LEIAEAQGVSIEKRDIILIRTGWISVFYDQGASAFYEGEFNEHGITYTPELVQWFYDMEIPAFGTDTIANEQTVSSRIGTALPLHGALLRNLGVSFNEIDWLEDLADDCASDGQYTFLYAAAPLKIVQGTGAPVNPIVVK
jgi:kynurenine formamidase